MREIVLDTETTGLSPKDGHRLVEIGCLELYNHIPTGKQFHCFINPERDMPYEAFRVHGLSAEFLSQHKTFSQIVDGFLSFIMDTPLIIHNARFDMTFINAELTQHEYQALSLENVIDTLSLARQQFPGSQVSLDALCRRFGVDNSARTVHGALLDAELLAEVYLELRGGRQPSFGLVQQRHSSLKEGLPSLEKKSWPVRTFSPSDSEQKAHQDFIKTLDSPLWLQK